MPSPPSAPGVAARSVLFVARAPDETLRTYLPIVDRLRDSHGLPSRVLFHHDPGEWAREELRRRQLQILRVRLPTQRTGAPVQSPSVVSRAVQTAGEIVRFWRVRRLARRILDRERPAAVVVIQDTLLLERFLVREANRRGIPTIVVQWAFIFPQAIYDRLRAIQFGPPSSPGPMVPAEKPTAPARGLGRAVTRALYRGALQSLGLSFNLANSFGGGEARVLAVMGQAFREQCLAQGVRDKEIVVTGHPTHDLAYARAARVDDAERDAIRARYGIPTVGPLILYATQPVLWRRVITQQELEANVAAIARAVAALPVPSPRFVLKLHPREEPQQYAFCAALDPPVQVILHAEMPDLVAACDAFVSSSSTTVLLAMMLDRPIVTLNFNQVPHFDFFEPLGGTLHTRSGAGVGAALCLALDDEPTRARLAQERRSVLDRYTRFDGRATERLADLVAHAVVSGPAPAA